jgi:hypothetical protein
VLLILFLFCFFNFLLYDISHLVIDSIHVIIYQYIDMRSFVGFHMFAHNYGWTLPLVFYLLSDGFLDVLCVFSLFTILSITLSISMSITLFFYIVVMVLLLCSIHWNLPLWIPIPHDQFYIFFCDLLLCLDPFFSQVLLVLYIDMMSVCSELHNQGACLYQML